MQVSKNLSLWLLIGMLGCCGLYAEEGAAAPAAKADAEEAETTGDNDKPKNVAGDIGNLLEDYISSNPKLNNETIKCFTGVGDIAVPAGKKGHALSRIIAYHQAFLEARKSFGKHLETEIKSALSYSSQEGTDAPLEGVSKVIQEQVVDMLRQQAQAKGIDVSDPAALKKYIKENIVGSQNFKQNIAAFGNAFQQGLIAYKTFSSPTQVGVVAVFSKQNMQAAKALRTGTDNGIRGKAKRSLREQVPTDPVLLASAFGCRILRDEKGERCIIGYGHGVALSKSASSKRNARSKADLQAMNEIKQFAGEMIVFGSSQDKMQSSAELSDEKTVVENSESFSESVKQAESSLKINGLIELGTRLIELPSGETICVAIRAWKPSAAVAAKRIAAQMLVGKDQKNQGIAGEAPAASAGEKAASAASAPAAAPAAMQPYQGRKAHVLSGEKTQLKARGTTGQSDESDLD